MRNVLVTGASTGIGEATALRLDEKHWRVFASVRREADAQRLQDRASAALLPLIFDVTDAGALESAAKAVEAEVGEAGLQGLVNNAGISVPAPLEFQRIDAFRQQIEVNLIGQLAVTQRFLPGIRSGQGRIVNVGSMGGFVSNTFLGAYCASKFGLEAVTDSLRRELRPWSIPVSIVQPGAISTRIWERGQSEGERVRADFSPRARELYGEMAEKVSDNARRTEARGIPAEVVARVIERALTDERPRTRYRVGFDAKAVRLLTWLLPDRAMDALLARAIGTHALHPPR